MAVMHMYLITDDGWSEKIAQETKNILTFALFRKKSKGVFF